MATERKKNTKHCLHNAVCVCVCRHSCGHTVHMHTHRPTPAGRKLVLTHVFVHTCLLFRGNTFHKSTFLFDFPGFVLTLMDFNKILFKKVFYMKILQKAVAERRPVGR